MGEKSDSFSRAERTRPLRPVSRLLFRNFGNVPAERFQRNFSLLKSADTARRVPTKADNKVYRAGTERNEVVEFVRLLQLSAAGGRFLGGEEPPESLSADSEIPCAVLLAHGEGG